MFFVRQSGVTTFPGLGCRRFPWVTLPPTLPSTLVSGSLLAVLCARFVCVSRVCVCILFATQLSLHIGRRKLTVSVCVVRVCACVCGVRVRAVRVCVVSVWPILTKFYYGVIFSPCHVIPTHSGRLKIIFYLFLILRVLVTQALSPQG